MTPTSLLVITADSKKVISGYEDEAHATLGVHALPSPEEQPITAGAEDRYRKLVSRDGFVRLARNAPGLAVTSIAIWAIHGATAAGQAIG